MGRNIPYLTGMDNMERKVEGGERKNHENWAICGFGHLGLHVP
jgi:hypothetical protein